MNVSHGLESLAFFHTGFLTKKHQSNLGEDGTVEKTCLAFCLYLVFSLVY